MPRKPPSPCNAPGCRAVCVGRYCDAHAHLAAGWRRSKRHGRGMGGRPWRRLRDRIMERDGYICRCEDCARLGRLRPAHHVDHIIPVSAGGADDPGNLRAINRDCHAAKTQRESVEGR